MSNFNIQIIAEEVQLDFSFSLIHTPDGERYLVIVANEGQPVTSFYINKTVYGTWKLSDRFKTVPAWVHPLEPQLTEAISQNYKTGED